MSSNWEIAKAKLGLTKEKQMARCPNHNDSTASLSVKRNGDDVIMHCFANCDWREVRNALGLTYEPKGEPMRVRSEPPKPARYVVARYEYRDYAGDVVAYKTRWFPKTFQWHSLWPDGEFRPGFREGMGQGDLPLYNVHIAMEAAKLGNPILVVESEKTVDRLTALGLYAVSGSEGASGAASAYDSTRYTLYFPKGTEFVLWADNDDPGRKHMHRLAETIAPHFSVSHLQCPNLPEKGDGYDYVESCLKDGKSDADVAAEIAYMMAHAMPHVRPSADVSEQPLMASTADAEAVTERAAILAEANAWPYDACQRIARHQVGARVARERATLTPAQRLALETTDPALRDIYAQLAALTG